MIDPASFMEQIDAGSGQLSIAWSQIWQMSKGDIRSGSIQIIAFMSDCVVHSLIVNHLDIGDNYPFFLQYSW